MHSNIKLPEDYLTLMGNIIPEHLSMDDFIACCKTPLKTSVRVNTLKISVEAFQQLAKTKQWLLTPIPWCLEGFWLEQENTETKLGNSWEHIAGLFYIQEASSMLPVTALFKAQVTDVAAQYATILDCASSPGSKTSQIAALCNNNNFIVANELSSSRLKVLSANIQRCGIKNIALSHYDANVFGTWLPEMFDAVLLDAPCSGEGAIRKDDKAMLNWSLKSINDIADIQKELIESAFKALKPGGTLIYSTCTLNNTENQAVCQHLLDLYPDHAEVVPLNDLFPTANNCLTAEGYLHVWPQIYNSEGFFVAKFTKKESQGLRPIKKKKRLIFPFSPVSRDENDAIRDYFRDAFSFEFESGVFYHRDSEIWLFPKEFPAFIGKFKFDRIGIKIAEKFKKGFRAQHEWARTFGHHCDKNTVSLNIEQAKQYIMGRDISFSDIEIEDLDALQGELVVLLEGSVLGLGKRVNQRLKNNYPRDLVRDNNLFTE
ncbi:MAG: 16S rRNA (cytosine1407-C5)-methyltransferase [Moritella dasanensis]